MKNLKQVFAANYKFPELERTDCFCVGVEENLDPFKKLDSLYCYCKGIIFSVSGETSQAKQVYDLRGYYSISANSDINLDGISIEYQYLTRSLVVALANGDVFSLELETNEIQCVGSVDSGLRGMEWSPDLETVVFATGQNTIILMSGSFDPITEQNLFDTGLGVKQMVNVGWGKKETQFHGSEGKAARTAVPLQGLKEVFDDKKTRISWRADSSLFVISFWSDVTKKREIKIFNQEGLLQCNGEALPGLEQSISWRPSGNLIALTQKLPNKHVVSFMEKNGLLHGNFVLPPDVEVKELCWNIDSTILCVVCPNKLLFYTMSNYHWYLKQQLDLSSSPVLSVKWDHNAANMIHIFQLNGTYSVYQWLWNVCRTPSLVDNDGALVAVIDGCKVLLSSFKRNIIPPPMSDHTIQFNEPVNEIVFAPGHLGTNGEGSNYCSQSTGCDVNNFFVYLYNKTLVLVTDTVIEPKILNEYTVEKLEVDCLHHFNWINPETLLCCGIKSGGQYYLCELNLESDKITAKRHVQLENPVLSLISLSTSSSEAIVELTDGQLYRYSAKGDLMKMDINLTEPCNELIIYDNNIIGLSELKRLYYNGNLVTSKATSFFIIPPFILITTSEHTLLVYKIGEEKCEHISCRKLERGSKIVTAVHDNIILQMPRGNLETIQPRALTLHSAAFLISKCEYKKLFSLFRKHRINMNLIVDHQPQTFLLNVSRFVHQIKDPSDLSLFLSELADVDVTRDIYKEYYNQDDRPPIMDKKVERVCQALRGVMMTSIDNEIDYHNPIITTYVKTSDMNEALNFASQSSSCLKHLLFLVDVDKLYDYALGFYNLEMAMKIAEKSKKNPQEYIPYLKNLKKMDPEYMKYTIDCQFKKYDSALKNISQSLSEEHFKEALLLIENHKLYPLALQLYKPYPERHKQVSLLFAEYLMIKHAYEEAALMFTRCEKLNRALDAYVDAGLWRNAVVIANKTGYSSEEICALCLHILPILMRKGSWGEAASLSQEILKDETLVVEYLVQGKLWDKAFYYASLMPSIHMESAVMPFVKEEATSILDFLKENLEKIKKYITRLTELRLQKAKKKEQPVSDIDISDMQSDISSVSSNSYNTSRTGSTQSSKNTRKMQKKMWSLKEGNPREEFALLSVISQLVKDLEKMTEDVSRSCSALLYFNDDDFDNLALTLQTLMKQTLKTVQEIRTTVWPPQPNENDITTANELQDAQLKFPPSSCIKPSWSSKALDIN